MYKLISQVNPTQYSFAYIITTDQYEALQKLGLMPCCASLNIHKPVKMAIMSGLRQWVRITSL